MFAHIASEFPSREILNNIGVAHALEVLDLFTQSEPFFAYPFELDTRTRLRKGLRAAPSDSPFNRQHRHRLLGEARKWFEQARHKDRSYLPPYINLAGVADLQGAPMPGAGLDDVRSRLTSRRGYVRSRLFAT